jgi:hypothetical protein
MDISDNLFKKRTVGTSFVPSPPLTEEQRQDAFLREHSPKAHEILMRHSLYARELKAGNAELHARLDASNREAARRDKLGMLGRVAEDIERGKELLQENGNRQAKGVTVSAAVMAPVAEMQMSRSARQ